LNETYAKEAIMLKIILTLAAVAVMGTLSGCGGMFGDAVRHVRTPDADICQKAMGLPIDDAEENLDMGKPDSVNNKTGEQIRSYTKGNLKAVLTVNAAGKVIEANCEPFNKK
jgi:hypothetical protein